VLTTEHLLRLGHLDFLIELVERAREVRRDVFARIGPFDEHGEIVAPAFQGISKREVLLQPSLPLQGLLRFRLVVPEIWCGDTLLELGQLLRRVCDVKDASAGPPPAC
jgi:hypothetical protein